MADWGLVRGVPVSTGAWLAAGTTFKIKPVVIDDPCGSVAVTETLKGLPTVVEGVPVITPVVRFILNSPDKPVAEYVNDAGVSASVNAVDVVSEKAEFTVAVCGLAIAATTVGAVLTTFA